MEKPITQIVLSLQARAFRIHGIPWDVFPTLTPKELAILDKDVREEFEAKEEIWDARFANLMHITYVMNAGAKSKKLKPQDFMPQRRQKKVEPLSGDALLAKVEHYELMETTRNVREEREASDRHDKGKPHT